MGWWDSWTFLPIVGYSELTLCSYWLLVVSLYNLDSNIKWFSSLQRYLNMSGINHRFKTQKTGDKCRWMSMKASFYMVKLVGFPSEWPGSPNYWPRQESKQKPRYFYSFLSKWMAAILFGRKNLRERKNAQRKRLPRFTCATELPSFAWEKFNFNQLWTWKKIKIKWYSRLSFSFFKFIQSQQQSTSIFCNGPLFVYKTCP